MSCDMGELSGELRHQPVRQFFEIAFRRAFDNVRATSRSASFLQSTAALDQSCWKFRDKPGKGACGPLKVPRSMLDSQCHRKIARLLAVVLSEFANTRHVFPMPRFSFLRSPARHRLPLVAAVLAIGLLSTLSGLASAPVRLATVPVAAGPWLDRFNAWRGSAGLSTLSENTVWSAGDLNHSRYMVKNQVITHYEVVGNAWYTTDGELAGRKGNIFISSTTTTTDSASIDWWMQAPFHAMGMIDPRLTQTGFGSYRDSTVYWQMGASLDVLQGNPLTGGAYPVYFPGKRRTQPVTTYGGGESPDPLQGPCAGYTLPTGLPVFIQVGGNVATTAGPVHTIVGNNAPGTLLENCVLDSSSPNVGTHPTFRGGVVLIPRVALLNGVTYTVALTVNSLPYTWSFTVGPLAPPPSVTGVSPNSGSIAGGTTVTVSGSGFTGVTSVNFGTTAATSFTIVSDTQITAVSPAHAAGIVDVTVTTPARTSAAAPADQFIYLQAPVGVFPAMSNGAYGGYITAATIKNIGSGPALGHLNYFDPDGGP